MASKRSAMNPVGRALGLSAALMLIAAIVLAVAVDPLWGLIAGLVAVTDGVLAVLLGSGAIGTSSAGRDAEAAGGPASPEPAAAGGPDLGTLADGTPIREGENPLVDED